MKKTITCIDLNRKKHQIEISKLTFRPSVYGILIENGKILLSKQWDGYDFPGGGVEIDETTEEALEREFFEETGLKVKKVEILSAITDFFIMPFNEKAYNSICIYFLVKKIGGKISIKNIVPIEKTYIKGAESVPISKINKLKFYNSANTEDLIKKALKLK